MNGRHQDTPEYIADREKLVQALLQRYREQGLTTSDLIDFYPKLDDKNHEQQHLTLCDHLVTKFRLLPSVAVAEMHDLLDGQVAALLILYKLGFRGEHLRQWRKNDWASFTENHKWILEWLRLTLKVTPEQAVYAINHVNGDSEYNVLLELALGNLLQGWSDNEFELSVEALLIALDKLPTSDALKKSALAELFIRWLIKEITLSDAEITSAIGLLSDHEFNTFRCTVPLSEGQINELANMMALIAMKSGDFTVAARLYAHHHLNMAKLNEVLLDNKSKRELKIHELIPLGNDQQFIRALSDGLHELESSRIGDGASKQIMALRAYLDEFMDLSTNIKSIIDEHGFTCKEATLFTCSEQLRDVVKNGMFNNAFMQDLARAASLIAQPGDAEANIFLEDVKESISKADLYAMMNKYMLKFAKKTIDSELSDYLSRNALAIFQRSNRAASLHDAAKTETTRNGLKALIDYQFGLITGSLPEDKIKGARKHELPLSKPVPEDDDYYQTISKLKGSPYLNN